MWKIALPALHLSLFLLEIPVTLLRHPSLLQVQLLISYCSWSHFKKMILKKKVPTELNAKKITVGLDLIE